jgi:hypothetical protein
VTGQEPDPELAARLRASSEARVQAQIQAARQQAAGKRAGRAAFTQNRAVGLRNRHAAKAARLGLIQFHDAKETTTVSTRDPRITAAADNYVLRCTERSRADDKEGDLTDEPKLAPQVISTTLQALTVEAEQNLSITRGDTDLLPDPRGIYPAMQPDGQLLHCRTSTMTAQDVDGALITLAAEAAALAARGVEVSVHFTALTALRQRLSGTDAANVRPISSDR